MAYTFTPNINLAKPDAGQTSYAGSVNDNFDKIDALFSASGANTHRHTGVDGDGGTIDLQYTGGTIRPAQLPAYGTIGTIWTNYLRPLISGTIDVSDTDIIGNGNTNFKGNNLYIQSIYAYPSSSQVYVVDNLSDALPGGGGNDRTIQMGTGRFNVIMSPTRGWSEYLIYTSGYKQQYGDVLTPTTQDTDLKIAQETEMLIFKGYVNYSSLRATYYLHGSAYGGNGDDGAATFYLNVNGTKKETFVEVLYPDSTTFSLTNVVTSGASEGQLIEIAISAKHDAHVVYAGSLYVVGLTLVNR